MHNIEVTIKMFQTKIDVINFTSIPRISTCLARERMARVFSPAICGHRSGDSQERLYETVEIEPYNDCMGTRSTATALQSGNSLATSIILWAAISSRNSSENVGLPAAASTTEIKDSLDFKTIIRHNFRQRGRVLSHNFAEHFMLFFFDMDEGKNEKNG